MPLENSVKLKFVPLLVVSLKLLASFRMHSKLLVLKRDKLGTNLPEIEFSGQRTYPGSIVDRNYKSTNDEGLFIVAILTVRFLSGKRGGFLPVGLLPGNH